MRTAVGDHWITAECSCGEWAASRPATGRANTLTRQHRSHAASANAAARDRVLADEAAFYQRCGHCGGCGGPDGYCCCDGACGCRDLHPPGEPDPLGRYSAASVDQPELFG